MITRPNPIPPLPPSWPFALRVPLPALHSRKGEELPGLGGGWTLCAPQDFQPPSAAESLGASFGRGGVRRAGEWVLRPYRRGGWVRHFNERIYGSPSRFEWEYRVHRALWEAGFPTVEPLGYAFRRAAWGFEGVFLTRYRESVPWPRRWERSGELLPRLRVLLEALCAWGLHAPDLNATNILLASDGSLLALDWDKARWIHDSKLMERYLERMGRSLAKLHAPVDVQEALGRD